MAPPRPGDVPERWGPPVKGVLRNFPIHLIPPDSLYDALNVLMRDGRLMARPGSVAFAAQSLGARVSGAFSTASLEEGAFQSDAFQNDAFQTTALSPGSISVAGTDVALWVLLAGNWVNRTGATAFTGNATLPVRFTSIEIGTTVWILATNGRNTPQKWDQAAPTFVDVTGSPPAFADWTTASNRIVGILPPYTVRWGNSLDIGTWPALNFRTLSDSPDKLKAIRNLGTLGVIIYKERSIWVGLPFGATDASFFTFELRRQVEGPAGVNAVVDAEGIHYYMTSDGRVGTFDGYNHRWVGDGVWPSVRMEIDKEAGQLVHGVYDPLLNEVHFYYRRTGDIDVQGVVTVVPPRPTEGIEDYISFQGKTAVPFSASTARLGSNKEIILFHATAFTSWKPAVDSSDAGVVFTGFWHGGLRPSFKGDMFRIESIETFAERAPGYGIITVAPVSSFDLDTEGGTIGAGKTVDLTVASVKEDKGFNVRGRFMGLRYSFTSPVKIRYHGAVAITRRVE